MKYCLFLLTMVIAAFSSTAVAQHVEIGGFGAYESYDQSTFPDHGFGLGGRVGFHMHRHLQFEFETGYDFKHPSFRINSTVTGALLTNTQLGVLHVNSGLKLQSAGGSFFFFLKGGGNRFDTELTAITINSIPTVSTLTQGAENSYWKGVLYPGAGLAFYAGPLGIRIDGGDEIYWDNGARHNLRFTFGPTIRF